MNIIYHSKRPYLPLLACALHLGLNHGAEPFLPGLINHDWQTQPLHVAGRDETGALVCCLVHGRHRGLYRRTLAGMAGIFSFSLAWVDLDQAMADHGLSSRLRIILADRLPTIFGRRFGPDIAGNLRTSLLNCEEG